MLRCTLIVFLLCPNILSAQDIIGMGTLYHDSFRVWDVHTTEEWRTGKLNLRWPLRDDWSEWDFRLGDTTAQIRLKWPDDPNLWEISCMGTTVMVRTTWPGNFTQWRLNDGTHRLTLQSRYGNNTSEWILRERNRGYFNIYTYWEGDPRDWVVIDELDPDISYAMRVALIFIALFHSVPKV